ncbi:MAG: SGNH/GDSL hydrolase family protein, partial [Bdellovibrionales bacterium]|nr:SGNH/GDSL hydrolase family protein [Bdellovibrionales bacterium]
MPHRAKRSVRLSLLAFLFVLALPIRLFACPLIDGIVDFNCDGKIRIAFTGDSIVKGVGDEKGLGYPGRLSKKISTLTFENIGVAGITARLLRRLFLKNLPKGNVTTQKSTDLDYMLIEVGTNSYWDDEPASLTVRDIKRLKKTLEEKLAEMFTVAPLVIVSTLPPVRRDYQQPFIDSVNSLLLKKKKSLRVKVRLDKLPLDIISDDNLHPDGKGYARITKLLKKKIYHAFPKTAATLRSDEDGDNLYDELELAKFGTDPTLADTDGDTISDGDEVFIFSTDPLSAES